MTAGQIPQLGVCALPAMSMWLLPAAISLEIGIEEDPLASVVVPQGGEVAIRGPGQCWPAWTPLNPGGRTQLKAPVDQSVCAVAEHFLLLLLENRGLLRPRTA